MKFQKFVLIALFTIVFPVVSYAACVNPPAEMGVLIMNTDHKVMQYCNGDEWIGLWGSGGGGGAQRISGEIAAFALSDCPEGWSEYAPARGRFLRGIDPSGANDVVRVAGHVQADALKSHTHAGTAASAGAHNHTGTAASAGGHAHSGTTNSGGQHNHNYRFNNGQGGSNETFSTSGGRSGGTIVGSSTSGIFPSGEHSHSFTTNTAGAHTHALTIDSAGAHTHSLTINATGDSETRPKNVAVLYCIKD